MADKPFRASKASGVLALVLLAASAVVIFIWRTSADMAPGDYEVKKGHYRLEDGQLEDALREFSLALEKNSRHVRALHGLAVTHLQMGNLDVAVEEFTAALAIDPEFSIAYADRGITFDRIGRYQEAMEDYRKALELDPDLEAGPGRIWRFLRNVSEKPPSIRERADYIEKELAKPPEERLLKYTESDEKQRMYKK